MALHVPRRACTERVSRSTKRLSVAALLLVAGCCILAAFGASRANGDVGDLGPPPAEPEIKQALIDFYSAGHPLGSTVEVRFHDPIVVGERIDHANPPPDPWCVRCGYPDQGISPMYPVMAMVTVTISQGLESSALAPSDTVESTATYGGTLCPTETQAKYCPNYYFYRDGQGNWQIA